MRLVVVLSLLVSLTGCASAEARRLATELRKQTDLNREGSQPGPGVDRALWNDGQGKACEAARKIESELNK